MTLDLADAEVLHNNLGGHGPDADGQYIHYASVGTLDNKPFDLKVTTVGKYVTAEGSAPNGMAGAFGSVNIAYGEMAKLQFAFYWSGTDEEVELPEIRWRFLDLDTDAQDSECKEVVGVDSADRGVSYILGGHPELMVEVDHTETWFMSEQVGEADNPASPEDVTEEMRDRSVTLVFEPANNDTSAAAETPASFCQDGIQSSTGGICCPTTCGVCGGARCEESPGGPEQCCGLGIRQTHGFCTSPTQTACRMPTPEPTVLAEPKFGFKVDIGFTQPQWGNPPQTLHSHTAWCANGVRGVKSQENVCCPGMCGQCGGAACASLPGGFDNCCTSTIVATNTSCADGAATSCIVPTVNQVAEEERVTQLEPSAFNPDKCFNSLKARTFLFDGSVASSCATPSAASPAWYKHFGPPAKAGLALNRAQSKTGGFCAKGVHSTRTKHLCCDSSCGTCGGAGCQTRPGGKGRCCATGLTFANVTCADKSQTACLVPQHASDLRTRLRSRSRLASLLQEELGDLTLQELKTVRRSSGSSVQVQQSQQQQQQAAEKRANAKWQMKPMMR